MSLYVMTYDVGTTGIKTCIFDVDDAIRLVHSEVEGYKLYIDDKGGAEQDPDEIWQAMCVSTKRAMIGSGLRSEQIVGLSFCSQMQGLVLVDASGNPIRRIMSYMDQRANRELKEGITHGIKVSGLNAIKLFKSIRITGVVAASVKDPVWKYNWVKRNEPENFAKIYKWLDVKEYLILKCTDQFVMTKDSAFSTMLYDIRAGKNAFSTEICEMLGVERAHLPKIVSAVDQVGTLTSKAARQLGLSIGTKVFGGGGDASLIGVGAGAVEVGSTHIYSGTSGWVSTVVKDRKLDLTAMIASIVGANDQTYNYFSELETASKCLEWVKDHLALDEINIYLDKVSVSDTEDSLYKNLFDFMMSEIKDVPAGSDGVIFTPWLHGNRCPFEDPNARGMFFNISLETGKRDMIHAVLEGICYHLRWQLEAQEKKIKTSKTIRFVGGGALSELTCQILSDVLDREIETIENPQNVGAKGAAIIVAVGLGVMDNLSEASRCIKADKTYYPNGDHKKIHDRNFEAFKRLYLNNKKIFRMLNQADS